MDRPGEIPGPTVPPQNQKISALSTVERRGKVRMEEGGNERFGYDPRRIVPFDFPEGVFQAFSGIFVLWKTI